MQYWKHQIAHVLLGFILLRIRCLSVQALVQDFSSDHVRHVSSHSWGVSPHHFCPVEIFSAISGSSELHLKITSISINFFAAVESGKDCALAWNTWFFYRVLCKSVYKFGTIQTACYSFSNSRNRWHLNTSIRIKHQLQTNMLKLTRLILNSRNGFIDTRESQNEEAKIAFWKWILHSGRRTQTCSLWHTLIHIHHLQSLHRSGGPNLCHILLGVTRHERCMHDILERGYTPRGNDFHSVSFRLARCSFSKVADSSRRSCRVWMWIQSRWVGPEPIPCTVLKDLSSVGWARMGYYCSGKVILWFCWVMKVSPYLLWVQACSFVSEL